MVFGWLALIVNATHLRGSVVDRGPLVHGISCGRIGLTQAVPHEQPTGLEVTGVRGVVERSATEGVSELATGMVHRQRIDAHGICGVGLVFLGDGIRGAGVQQSLDTTKKTNSP